MKFRLKLVVWSVLVLILTLGGFYAWTRYEVEDSFAAMVDSGLEEHLDSLAPLISARDPEVDRLIDLLCDTVFFRITVIRNDGKVVADSAFSGERLDRLPNHLDRPEFVEARRIGKGRSSRYSETTHQYLVYMAKPLHRGDGFIRIAKQPASIEHFATSLLRALSWGGLAMVLLGGFAIWVIATGMTRSIGKLSEAAIQIAGGTFISEIPLKTRDEVGMLARRMEEMSKQLEAQLQALESERNHLTAVLNSMMEGVVVMDPDGRVTGTNPAFLSIFQPEVSPVGRNLQQVSSDRGLTSGIEAIQQGQDFFETEISTAGRSLQAKVRVIGDRPNIRGIVAVFHDITELRRLGTLQKEFISNVSHELKTPLTSIQGYAETLVGEEGLSPIHLSFAQKIYRNSSELTGMIEELFSLARLESGEPRLLLSRVRFDELMQEMKNAYIEELSRKHIEYSWVNSSSQSSFLAGDRYIRRVFHNLIANSIKYTDQGSIVVKMMDDGDYFRFVVEDTGIGIPEEALSRIFERFYRVDKHRSRKTGGSGIGLAIVKHIVQMHKGRAWAESLLDHGTSILFTLPRHGMSQNREGEVEADGSTGAGSQDE